MDAQISTSPEAPAQLSENALDDARNYTVLIAQKLEFLCSTLERPEDLPRLGKEALRGLGLTLGDLREDVHTLGGLLGATQDC